LERWERPGAAAEPPRIAPEGPAPDRATPETKPVEVGVTEAVTLRTALPAAAQPAPAAPSFLPPAPPPLAYGPHVPEDSVLRRHFFGQTRHVLETLRPAPTDSVLRRHHGQWLCAESEASGLDESHLRRWTTAFESLRDSAPIPAPAAVPAEPAATGQRQPRAAEPLPAWIPGDSVLRRHFYTHIRTMLDAVGPPPASDAVLEVIARDESRLGRLQADYATWRAAQARPAPASPTALAAAASPTAVRPKAAAAPSDAAAAIPEDSVLRRHFLARVRAALEGPNGHPTESVLRRHREQWLCAQMEETLADRARLKRLLDSA
jgi:hypothetical protein